MPDTRELLKIDENATKINVIDAHRDELPPLHFDDEEPEVPERDEEPEEVEIPVSVTPKQVATFLRATYEAHGILTQEQAIWARDPSFFEEVADGITDHINDWCAKFPALASAIHAVDAAGSWGRLIWDYSLSWYSTLMVKRQRRIEAEQAEEEARQAYGRNNGTDPFVQ